MKTGNNSGPFKPVRMCAACRKREEKDRLVRIVKNEAGGPEIDKNRNAQKRGVYLCRAEDCVRRAQKTRALQRSLQCGIEEEFYEELIRSIQHS